MKKIVVFLVLAVMGVSSAFCQLRVVNNFGQNLNVENGGKTLLIPDKGIGIFDTRTRTATLSCSTPDNKIKFIISRNVSRLGLVKILPGDGVDVITQISPVAEVVTDVPVVVEQPAGESLASILKGTATQTPEPVINSEAVNQTSVTKEPITIEYYGTFTLKIISSEGQGIELLGLSDSIDNSAPRRYVINVLKNADLVIGFGEKKGDNQIIWPYGEIRKHIGAFDQVCEITDTDVQMFSTYETRKLRFKVDAKDYKILIKNDDELISLGHKGVSKLINLPIGQSYVRIAYTDPQGVFHPTAFMPVQVTSKDRYISITASDITNALTLSNW